MANTYIAHTYFNQDEYVGMLNAIVMICGGAGGSGDYTMLVKTVAIIGLMSVMLFGIWRARGEDAVSYVIAFAIIYSCLFIPRVTVEVHDHGAQIVGARAPRTVDNVPIGLAFFVTATSRIGYWLTNQFDMVFSLPNGMDYKNAGLMGGSRLLREVAGGRMDQQLANDISAFVQYCLNPEIVASGGLEASPMSFYNISKQSDIWDYIKPALNAGRPVSLPSETGLMYCIGTNDDLDAYYKLTNKITGQTSVMLRELAQKIFPTADTSAATATIIATLPQVEAFVYGASASAQTSIRQGMVLNLFNDLGSNVGSAMNNPSAVLQSMGAAQAASNANASFRISAELAKQSLPFVHNVIELIIIGIFPIVFLLMVAAGPKVGFVIRNYVVALLWIQLWAPIYAIVNYIGMMQVASNVKPVMIGTNGLTISNVSSAYDTLLSGEAIAGMMTGLVAVISFAILKGGEVAMSGLVQSVTRPAESAAQQAGSQAGSGKVDMGNVNWGNVTAYNTSANQHNNAPSIKSGFMDTEGPAGRQRIGMNSGNTGFTQSAASQNQSVVRVGMQFSSEAMNSLANNHETAVANERAANYVRSKTANMSEDQKGEYRHSMTEALNRQIDKQSGTDSKWNTEEGRQIRQAFSDKNASYDAWEKAYAKGVNFNLGVSDKYGEGSASAGASFRAQSTTATGGRKEKGESSESATVKGMQQAMSEFVKELKSVARSMRDEQARTGVLAYGAGLRDSVESSQSESVKLTDSEKVALQEAVTAKATAAAGGDFTNFILNRVSRSLGKTRGQLMDMENTEQGLKELLSATRKEVAAFAVEQGLPPDAFNVNGISLPSQSRSELRADGGTRLDSASSNYDARVLENWVAYQNSVKDREGIPEPLNSPDGFTDDDRRRITGVESDIDKVLEDTKYQDFKDNGRVSFVESGKIKAASEVAGMIFTGASASKEFKYANPGKVAQLLERIANIDNTKSGAVVRQYLNDLYVHGSSGKLGDGPSPQVAMYEAAEFLRRERMLAK
jgi:hypothetical protein